MKGFTAGKLRHRVTVQQNAPATVDDANTPTDRWVTFGPRSVAAGVVDMTGTEGDVAGKTTATASHVVTLRYLAGLTREMRLKWGARYLNITSIANPDGRRRWHVLVCKETAA